MSDTLLIVESPAKAKAIQKYLGKGYTVKASMGHVRDLPENKLAVNVEKDFKPTFVILSKKKAVVAELHSAAQKADAVLLAADPDREGEAICYHLAEILKDTGKPMERVLLHEITSSAVKEAVAHPGDLDPRKVNAQMARRIIDRLVGYQISPLLWDKVKKGLSAGRVQTVALRMVCERETAIRAFVREEYWTLTARLEGEAQRPFEAKLTQWKGRKAEIHSCSESEAVLAELAGRPWTVSKVEKKKQKRAPLPPFITSKLQQEAARLLKFPVRKTMSLAQKLYEGVDLAGGETAGLITYMRTDSTRLSPQAIEAARAFVHATYGDDFVPPKPRHYAPAKASQDAHEAIRPTDVHRTPEAVKPFLSRDEFALYRLIWRRFVASQMADALFDATKVQVVCSHGLFSASGSVCTFQGFLAAYEAEEDNPENGKNSLPPLRDSEPLTLLELRPEQKFTEPPPRYTEASLVKALEDNGIGRPSTYAQIISTIQDREYVVKEGGSLLPTDLGELVGEILVKHFPALFDLGYTARLEEHLDKLENGHEDRLALLKRFWKDFSKEMEAAKDSMADLRKEGQPTDEKCEKCGKPMLIRMGRFGRFLACSGYPECKSTRPMPDEKPTQVPEEAKTCEKCGSPMVVRQGRYGVFLACERYPECKNTIKLRRGKEGTVVVAKDELLEEKCPDCGNPLVKKQGRYGAFVACSSYPKCTYIQKEGGPQVPCPKCGKALARRFTKRRKPFYGCTGYPGCDFVSWEKPIPGPCPKCSSPYLVEKRKGDTVHKTCPVKECGWHE
jgi:DNA topoisomerase I